MEDGSGASETPECKIPYNDPNDMTMFVRIFIELGIFGFVLLLILNLKLLLCNFRAWFMLFIILLINDNLFTFWLLPFILNAIDETRKKIPN